METFNISELALFLDVTRQTIYRWKNTGRLPDPITNKGYHVEWLKSDIELWVESTHAGKYKKLSDRVVLKRILEEFESIRRLLNRLEIE